MSRRSRVYSRNGKRTPSRWENWRASEWQDWFSKEAAFHRVVEWCLALQADRRVPESLARWPVYLQYLRPFHFRRALGNKARRWRRDHGSQQPAAAT